MRATHYRLTEGRSSRANRTATAPMPAPIGREAGRSARRVRAIARGLQCGRCASEASEAQEVNSGRAPDDAVLRDRLLAAAQLTELTAMEEFTEPAELGAAELRQFQQTGHLLLKGFVTSASVRALCQTLEAVTEGSTLAAHQRRNVEMEPGQPDNSGLVRRVYEPCTRYAPYQAFAESPLLLGVVAQLLGSPDLVYHYSKVNMKPPQVDTIVDWQCAPPPSPARRPNPPACPWPHHRVCLAAKISRTTR